jgi:hypothetical protein
MKDFFESKTFKILTWSLAVLLVLFFVFKAGMTVGQMRADFSCRWSDNYRHNFGGQMNNPLPMMGDRDFLEANGGVGKIIKIEGNVITVDDPSGQEKAFEVASSTAVKRFKENIGMADLNEGDYIVVMGEPGADGKIKAKLIRIMPSPERLNKERVK